MLSWIRSALLDNLSLKLFALLLAIVLFRRVHQEDLVRVATVDVKLVYAFPKKLMMTSEPVNSIKVTLQGPESILNKVLAASRGWKFTVGLSDASPGPMQTELYTQEIRSIFPGQIQVTRIKPSILNVRFEERAKRTLPVKILLKGKTPLGYKLLKPVRSYPQKMSIEGPKKIVSKLKELQTQPIDLSSQSNDETLWVKLQHPHKFVRFLGTSVVRVMLQVHVIKGSKKFTELPIKAINFAHLKKLDYELHPKEIAVTLFGPTAQLSLVKMKDIVIEADISKISPPKPGEHKVKLKIRPPAPDLKPLKPDRTITIRMMWRDGMAPEGADDVDAGSMPEPPVRRARRRVRPKPRRRRRRRRRRHRRRRKRRPTKSRARRRTRPKPRRRAKRRRPTRRRPARRRRSAPPKRRTMRRKPPRRRPSKRRPSKRRPKARKAAHSKHLRKRRIARRKRLGSKLTAKPRLLRVLKHLPSAKLPTPRRVVLPKKVLTKGRGKRPKPPAKQPRKRPPPKQRGE